MELPKFKIRCSGIGAIMSDPKGKSVAEQVADLRAEYADRMAKLDAMKPGLKTTEKAREMAGRIEQKIKALAPLENAPNLSETCKTFVKKWLIQQLTGKRVDFKSKPTDKGNAVEVEAIVYASCHIPEMGVCCKNEQWFSNEWMHGTPDVLAGGQVLDLKSSLSAETFPLFDEALPESDYAWQTLGYMELTNTQRGAVVYALMSMPEEMLEREARYKLGQFYTQDQYEVFAANYRYDDLPPSMRLKMYPVEYDAGKVALIIDRVMECRNYIETVLWPAYRKNLLAFPG